MSKHVNANNQVMKTTNGKGTELIAHQSMVHQGPLPDPNTLAKYEEICPGAADRILTMAEQQASHRQDIERVAVRSGSRDSIWGIASGLIIGLATTVSGTIIVLNGHEWPGAFLGASGLIGLVSVFVYGTRSNRKERENKWRQ